VQCGADIAKALIGQRNANDRVVVTEKKYGKLGLKHLGADEISDDLSSINWLICGAEYIVLVDGRNMIGDAMPWPAHSKQSPAFSGICRRGGKESPRRRRRNPGRHARRRRVAGALGMEDRPAARELRQDIDRRPALPAQRHHHRRWRPVRLERALSNLTALARS
jgi:hypothetical protein